MSRSDDQGNSKDATRPRRLQSWGAPIAGVLVILLALVGISAGQAEPVSTDETVSDDGDCHERGFRRHRGHGRHGFGHRGRDPEKAREHIEYATGWMLKRLDVEGDVRDQIQTRLSSAFDEILPFVEAHKGSREAWVESLLGAEGVDRNGIEGQRQEALAAADRVSQIVATTFADVAEMLTPEQRADIVEKIRRHHH